ncbi:MAG: helix-turn-helix domain-containing protein [Mycobacterium sp.]
MADIRSTLLAAADQLLAQGEAVSIEATAERAGVSRSTAYRYFSGRDDLLLHLATVRSGRLLDQAIDLVAREGTATTRLTEAMVYLFTAIPIDAVLAEFVKEGPKSLDRPATREAAYSFLGPLVTQAQQLGEFRNDYPPTEAVRWLVTQLLTAISVLHDDVSQFRNWFRWFVLPALTSAPATSDASSSIAASLRAHVRALGQLADRIDDDPRGTC